VNNLKNKEFCLAFGTHLKALRREKGLTLRGLALEADMEHSQLSKIERGINNPTISTVLALSRALEVSIQQMFDFKFPTREKNK
jgi:transcriptional regulator with XRE-family HTH domain